MKPQPENPSRSPGIAPVMERNIRTLLEKRQEEEARLGWKQRLAVGIANFTGSMTFVLIHVVLYCSWIAINIGLIPGIPRFDPSLVILAMEASVEAIFLSSFILITQNRMMAQADRRADLNLQISLLAEYEITRLITMTREIARAMRIPEGNKPELEELANEVAPE